MSKILVKEQSPMPVGERHKKRSLRSVLLSLIGAFVALFLIIQLIPYGRAHTNPVVVAEPRWDQAQTHQLFSQACADCHSNETVWPWYSNVAPVSWLVHQHVEEGRSVFNVSEWGRPANKGEEAAESLQTGEMPIGNYILLHPEARLSAADKQTLVNGLKATFGGAAEGSERDE